MKTRHGDDRWRRAIDGEAISSLDFLVQTSFGSSLCGVTQRIWPSDFKLTRTSESFKFCQHQRRQIQSKTDHVTRITLLD